MNRRETIAALLALAAAAQTPGAQAQGSPRTRRVGILILASLPSVNRVIEGLRDSLREMGYVEGRNLSIELLSAEGNADRLPALATQLVARKVEVILTGGGNVSTLAARDATKTIPIVMTTSVGAVEAGLVQSLARPGGNVTGLTVPRELGFKQLELLREIVPSLERVAILTRHDPALAALRAQATALAQQLMQITLDYVFVRWPSDLAGALEAARSARAQAMIVTPDPMLYQQREQILGFTRSARIPDMYPAADIVEDGGLMAYGPSVQEIRRTVARFVDRLLKGARAADLPVEQPTTFELVINLRTAKALGLAIPQSLVLRAERVIE